MRSGESRTIWGSLWDFSLLLTRLKKSSSGNFPGKYDSAVGECTSGFLSSIRSINEQDDLDPASWVRRKQ